MSRAKRLEAIRSIITNKRVGNQKALLQELADVGFKLTQATLSRDLQKLEVSKTAGIKGQSVYVIPKENLFGGSGSGQSLHNTLEISGFKSIKFSGNMAVIKTRPGYASSLAYDIDNQSFPQILGTVAGDDTIILVLRENCVHQNLENILIEKMAHTY